MANSFSRLERIYLQKQPVFGTIPNAGGVATLSGADACRAMPGGVWQNEVALLTRPDKTGTRSQEGMIGGRKIGKWSIEMGLVGSGTAGTVPDCDPLFVAAFGQTATIGSGSAAITSSTDTTPIVVTVTHGITVGELEVVTISGHAANTKANGAYWAYANSSDTLTLIGSVATGAGAGSGGTLSRAKVSYGFVDDIAYFTGWSFRTAATLDQRCAHTALVSEMTFNLNQDIATWTASGDCVWVLRSTDFANCDADQRGGLSAFPTEPATPVTTGSAIPGFTGRFVAGASTAALGFSTAAKLFTTIRNVTIKVQTGNKLVTDTFGSYYPTTPEGDNRKVMLSFNIYDDDSTEVQNLKSWGDHKTPVDFIINIGTEPGNTFVHILKNVYLAAHVLGDGQIRYDASYADSQATATSLAVRDEYTLVVA